ncbi:MAG TPA: hypothetical protein VKA48_10960 [Gammaproteobacteria bacterium]|nr:hypothetical protein [Gammaproteobacteria bacterium]
MSETETIDIPILVQDYPGLKLHELRIKKHPRAGVRIGVGCTTIPLDDAEKLARLIRWLGPIGVRIAANVVGVGRQRVRVMAPYIMAYLHLAKEVERRDSTYFLRSLAGATWKFNGGPANLLHHCQQSRRILSALTQNDHSPESLVKLFERAREEVESLEEDGIGQNPVHL